MSDPRRLLFDEEATDFAKELVRSWDQGGPAADGPRKTLAALGVAGAAVTAASVTAKVTVGSGGTAGGSLAPTALAGIAWLKWGGVGLVVAAAAIGGAMAWQSRTAAPRSAAAAAPLPSSPPVVEVTAPVPTTSDDVAVVAPPPTATTTAEAAGSEAPRALARPIPRPPTGSLDAQLAALDRARAALEGGDPAHAQALVDSYEAEYPSGAFVQEAEVLRIEALVRRGDGPGAERAAQRFFVAFPRSPHAARVRTLLGTTRAP